MRFFKGTMWVCVIGAFVSGCGGGGGGSSSGVPQAGPAVSAPTTSMSTRSYPLTPTAATYDLPPLAGFAGTLAFPAAAVPANTQLQLVSSLQALTDAVLLGQDALRRARSTGALDVYFYESVRISSTVTFPSLPGFSITLPSTVRPAGLQFFYAISNPAPTGGAAISFRTEGPATVTGQVLTFAPSSTPLTLTAGTSYTIALYAVTPVAALPTPSPAFTGKIYIATSSTNTLTTYTASGTRTTPTIAGLDRPAAVAVDANGKIYIANAGNGTVTTYTASGAPTTPTIRGLGPFGTIGSPNGVAVDAAGKIFVASSGTLGANGEVVTFTANGTPSSPTIAPPSAFIESPRGLAVDQSGKIYVTSYGIEPLDGWLTIYSPDGTQTTPQAFIDGDNPDAVAVDATGKIYLANTGSQASDPAGQILTYLPNGTPTTPTITPGGELWGVALDPSGNIYVLTDTVLRTYTSTGAPAAPTIVLAPIGTGNSFAVR